MRIWMIVSCIAGGIVWSSPAFGEVPISSVANATPAGILLASSDGAAGSPQGRTVSVDPNRSLADVQTDAERHLNRRQFQTAIALLDAYTRHYPNHYSLELLLGKALLGSYHQQADAGHRDANLLRRPFIIGKTLNKAYPERPGPYYLVAKVFLLKNRPTRARRSIAKAIHFCGVMGESTDLALYHEIVGDAYRAQKVPTKARKAYERGIYVASQTEQKRVVRRLKRKSDSLGGRFSD